MIRRDGRTRIAGAVRRYIALGVVAAIVIAALNAAVRALGDGLTLDAFAAIGIPFATSADPVLPTFAALLVAIAVLNISRIASGFVLRTVSVIAVLSVLWLAMTCLALFDSAFRTTEPAASQVIAALALGALCVSVSAMISELLPLSASSRGEARRQQMESLQLRLTRVITRLETVQVAPTSRWLKPETAGNVTVTVFALTFMGPVIILLTLAPFGPSSFFSLSVFAGGFFGGSYLIGAFFLSLPSGGADLPRGPRGAVLRVVAVGAGGFLTGWPPVFLAFFAFGRFGPVGAVATVAIAVLTCVIASLALLPVHRRPYLSPFGLATLIGEAQALRVRLNTVQEIDKATAIVETGS